MGLNIGRSEEYVEEICRKYEAQIDDHVAELATLSAENERLREKLYDITGRSAMAFKQLHDSLLNQAKESLK